MPRVLKISLFVLWPIIMFILIIQITGKVCLSYYGFAVDKSNNIYLGKDKSIDVLNDKGEVINKIDPMTSRGYSFTITENDEIIISTGDYWYRKDLSDNLIEKNVINDYRENPISTFSRYKYSAADGTEYVMKMHFFRTHIYKIINGEYISVYKMPLFDFCVRILSVITYLSFAVVVIVGIVIWNKKRKTI